MKHRLFLFFLLLLSSLVIFSSWFTRSLTHERTRVLAACVTHDTDSASHAHVQLTILQNGKPIVIPQSIGIAGTCMHPLHTHDNTGRIHMEYPTPFPFTLGDFFDLQGIVLTDAQIGRIKTNDGYAINVIVNGEKRKNNYRNLLLRDDQRILITIETAQK